MKTVRSNKIGDGGSEKPFTPEPAKTIPFADITVGGDVQIGNVKAGEILGGSRIVGEHGIMGRDIVVTDIIRPTSKVIPPPPKEKVLSNEQALGRIADAVRLNLGQLQLNMEQARRESSQFFRTTMIFSGVAFAIILGGVGMMLAGLVTAGIVTTAASVVPQAGALLLFNKDKELRRTIETYHGHILESQRVLTMIDLAETMGQTSAKDSMKEQIILTVLKVNQAKASPSVAN